MIEKIASTESPQGREISFYGWKINDSLPNAFILGGFHGDEPEGVYAVEHFMQESFFKTSCAADFNVYFLPCLNPDGKAAKTRVNANKVDLNRNYPTKNFEKTAQSPGCSNISAGTPASETETRFMMELVEKYSPARIISIHADLHLTDYDGPARELALKTAEITGYRFVENVGYPTTGSFGTWAGQERQIPLITLETPRAVTEEDFKKIYAEIRPALFNFIGVSQGF